MIIPQIRKHGNILIGLSFLILLVSPAFAAEKDAGKALAQKLCAKCHSIEKTGKSPEKLAPPFRTFAAKWPIEDLEEALAEGIVVGHDIMPEFELRPKQISSLLNYIASLSGSKYLP